MDYLHGGDTAGYRKEFGLDPMDFSSNVNPFGLPEGVWRAVNDALAHVDRRPDPLCRELTACIAQAENLPEDWILCGNGPAELIWQSVRICRPAHAAVVVPTFAEYELALKAAGCEVTRIALSPENGFLPDRSLLERLPETADMLFLCNPNNPTGRSYPAPLLEEIAETCKKKNIWLLMDESLNGFLDDPEGNSLKKSLGSAPKLLVLKELSNLYGFAGLPLGYLLGTDPELLSRMRADGSPWAVSSLAQAAGTASLLVKDYLSKSRSYLRKEKKFLMQGLEELHVPIIGSDANFLFFQTRCADFAAGMRKRGILVRDCGNFPGLDSSYIRVTVRTRSEDKRLLRAMSALQLFEAHKA